MSTPTKTKLVPRTRLGKGTRAVAEPARGLPRQVSSFVGRRREVADLVAALSTSRLVTLTGSSGIGKTRLALEVAARLGPTRPDGAWLVALAPVTEPDLVPEMVAAALGMPPEPGCDPTEALIAYLRPRRALVVLDNCEHLLDVCSALTERLVKATGRISVLATSQRPLGADGETVVPLRPMSLPDAATGDDQAAALGSEAVALFCARADAASPAGFVLTDAVAHSVVEICRCLDGIPLAIELAAARTGVLAPGDIAERLHDRFGLLNRGAATAPARHQTLRAAVDWSYDLLSPPAATLLRRLSVFTGGMSLSAIERVCTGGEVGKPEVVDLVSELVDRSLVIADTSGRRARYRLLETVREYGRDRLVDAAELDDIRTRHLRWCITMAERSWDQLTVGDHLWVDTLHCELDNIRAALDWTTQGHEPERGLRLATAMTPFWKLNGYLREGQVWLERVLRAGPDANGSIRARGHWGVGLMAVLQGDVATATAAAQECLGLAQAGGYERSVARALSLSGFISMFSQDPVAALPVLEESVALSRSLGDVPTLAHALMLYGRSHLYLGDVAAAGRVFEECTAITGEEDGTSLFGMGWVAVIAGEHRRAQDLFARALPAVRAIDERFETALVLSFLGELAWGRGELEEARARFDEALDLARAMGAPFPIVRCLCGLARVALTGGQPGDAMALVDEAASLSRRFPLPYAYVRCLHVQGVVRRALDDTDGARASFEDALARARGKSDRAGVAGSLHLLARLARHEGHLERAASLQNEALAHQCEIPDAAGIAGSLEAMAGLGVLHGRHAHAARLFGAALAFRDGSGSFRPPDEWASYDADVARLRAELEPASIEEAWAAGAGLSRQEAVALATRGRGARDRPSHGRASLTQAEREVVDLAAAGLTNAEIGDKLFVSGRTVQGHLLRAFPKLGVRSRRQLRELDPEA